MEIMLCVCLSVCLSVDPPSSGDFFPIVSLQHHPSHFALKKKRKKELGLVLDSFFFYFDEKRSLFTHPEDLFVGSP